MNQVQEAHKAKVPHLMQDGKSVYQCVGQYTMLQVSTSVANGAGEHTVLQMMQVSTTVLLVVHVSGTVLLVVHMSATILLVV